MTQFNLREERVYLAYTSHHSPSREIGAVLQQETGGGTDTVTMGNIAYSLSLLSYIIHGYLDGTWWVAHTTVGWTLPHQSFIKKTKPDMPTSQSEAGNFSLAVSSSQVTLVCVKLTKPYQHTSYETKRDTVFKHFYA